jgi:hypothetical protein
MIVLLDKRPSSQGVYFCFYFYLYFYLFLFLRSAQVLFSSCQLHPPSIPFILFAIRTLVDCSGSRQLHAVLLKAL